MGATALGLVLIAALLHALWNLAAKQSGGDHRFAFVAGVLAVLVWSPVALWLGVDELPAWGAREWALVLASALLHLVYFTVLLRGYRAADFTVVYPLARGSAPLLTVAAAVLLLGEALTAATAAGAAAVCAGVFLVAGGPAMWRRRQASPQAHARMVAGLRWGALAGGLIAAYTVVDGYAVKVLALSPILLDWFGNLLRLPFLLPAALHDPAALARAWRTQWRHALVVAVFGPLGYVLVLYAMTMAPLSHVAPARELSMLVAALLGARLLGEGDRLARFAGAACIAAGVVVLAW